MRHFAASLAAAIAAILIAIIVAAPAAAQETSTAAGAAIQKLFESTFHENLRLSPEFATFVGDYSRDGEWSDPSAAGLAKREALLTRAERALERIALSNATRHERNDARYFHAVLAAVRRGIAEEKTGRDAGGAPLGVLEITYTMIMRKAAQDDAVWWDHLIARLEKVPAFLRAARGMATHPGRLQGMTAAQQLAAAPQLFSGILTPMAASLPPGKKARFERARDATLGALRDWKAWIDANDQRWPVNYAMGAKAYNAMLKDEQLLPYDAAGIERIGRSVLAEAIAEETWIRAEAKARGVMLDASAGGGPTPLGKAEQFTFFKTQVDYLRDFVIKNNIVTVPDFMGAIRIEETPAFLLPILPGASMNPPPLLSAEKDGIYFVPPPNPKMAELAAKGAIFEDFDRDRVLMTSGHEGIPGHFLQLSIAKHNADPVRRYSFDGVFAEGWAFYEEEMLARMGLYGDDLDGLLAVAQFKRLRGARAVVDAKLATREWAFDTALAWFTANAGVDADTARGEVLRHALGPGQAFDYAVGKAQIEELLAAYRAKCGNAFDLRAFHDDLLSHGTVPLSIVSDEMLHE